MVPSSAVDEVSPQIAVPSVFSSAEACASAAASVCADVTAASTCARVAAGSDRPLAVSSVRFAILESCAAALFGLLHAPIPSCRWPSSPAPCRPSRPPSRAPRPPSGPPPWTRRAWRGCPGGRCRRGRREVGRARARELRERLAVAARGLLVGVDRRRVADRLGLRLVGRRRRGEVARRARSAGSAARVGLRRRRALLGEPLGRAVVLRGRLETGERALARRVRRHGGGEVGRRRDLVSRRVGRRRRVGDDLPDLPGGGRGRGRVGARLREGVRGQCATTRASRRDPRWEGPRTRRRRRRSSPPRRWRGRPPSCARS